MHVHGIGSFAVTVDPRQKRQRMSREKKKQAMTKIERQKRAT